ncbi:hypothetical protein BV20DRAFT_401373 [Pilatotrama ljubarskyi]|nr:hypothetical protein BV20DRAFT_401373 [Pilatotrama ljubarskyi]
MTGCLLLVPVLASCVSVALHIKTTCWPGVIARVGEVYVKEAWTVLGPRQLDSTTAILVGLTEIFAVIAGVHWAWAEWSAVKKYIRNRPKHGGSGLGDTSIAPTTEEEQVRRSSYMRSFQSQIVSFLSSCVRFPSLSASLAAAAVVHPQYSQEVKTDIVESSSAA